MRINLLTPFADKDKAKALGARWDAARKVWYIVDVADLTPFMRWIPDLERASAPLEPVAAAPGSAPRASSALAPAAKPFHTTRPLKEIACCGCKVLPWEDCVHTAAGAAGPLPP